MSNSCQTEHSASAWTGRHLASVIVLLGADANFLCRHRHFVAGDPGLKSNTNEKVLNFPQTQDCPLFIEDVFDDVASFFTSLSRAHGYKRLTFITDSGHSDKGFQLSMTIAKRCGLLFDLVQVTPEDGRASSLTPEIVILDAAGIPFTVSRCTGELRKEITRYVWQRKDEAAYIIDVSDEYWGFLRYHRHRVFDLQHPANPLVLLVENGCLV